MKRVSDPEIRKQQILDTAMRLFYEKGYENTSLEDIAGELHVVKSLCYRYFDSKQALFDAVLDEYTEECCRDIIVILHRRELSLSRRLNEVMALLLTPKEKGRYHDFFHKTGNEEMHDRLSLRMCRFLIPYVEAELALHPSPARESPRLTAQFLLYGMIGLWQENSEPAQAKASQFEKLVGALLDTPA